MEFNRIPRVKICCIRNVQEAELAIRHGASALGLVSKMPTGPGVISLDQIAEIASVVPPPIGTFLLTSSQDIPEIIKQQQYCRTNTLQICDRLRSGDHQKLREALPGISIVQVVHVCDAESVQEALSLDGCVDAVLLDSGNPLLPRKELGGTGRVHNWKLSRRIREGLKIPIFLAGGLFPGNVIEAIKTVGPFGLDVCSGVRTGEKLDPSKMEAFIFRACGNGSRRQVDA